MKQNQGFTLIEILVAVAIVAILASIALPSYRQYVLQGNRTEAQIALSETAAVLEKSYARKGSYGVVTDYTMPTLPAYTISLVIDAGKTYTLTAKPNTAQSKDECGTMTLNQAGQTTASKTDCWR